MINDADRCDGPEFDYLGHFRQRKFLAQGHNTDGGFRAGDFQPSLGTYGDLERDPSVPTYGEDETQKAPDTNQMRATAFNKELDASIGSRVGLGRDDPLDNAMRATRSPGYGKDI